MSSAPEGERVEIVDTTTRDGNQSLWSATGLTTPDVVEIAPTMDRIGFRALDFTSSTHMAVSVRFHKEDPWERIRRVSDAMPNTPLNFITTGMRFASWVPAGEDVIDLAFRLVVRNGIRRFQIAEPSNDPEALIRLARMAREAGVEEVVIGLTYSISPVHTHEYYLERARAVAASEHLDRLYLKDPGGLLTPDAVRELIPGFIDAVGPRPVELHSHCTISLGPIAYMEGLGAGTRTLHTALAPLANGTSNPSCENTLRNLEAEGYSHELDIEAIAEASDHFREIAARKDLPLGTPAEYDAAYYRHQMPGGMVTTTKRQLQEIGKPELFDATLEEVARVRAEMGYPIMVTPVSQFVATQAVMNVIYEDRWSKVSNEMVRYFHGHFFEPAAPVDPEVKDKVLSGARAEKLGKLEPISLEGARERFGEQISDEELLLRLTMSAEQVDAMLAEKAGAAR
jgi:oxaloacetate decarboxylase (Na+ extruding) subunit alpha